MSTATEELVGQTDLFEGKVVSAVVLSVKKFQLDYVTDGDPRLGHGDRVTIECELSVEGVGFPGKCDDLGVETQPIKRVQTLKALPGSVVIRKVQRQSDMQAAWEKEHGKP